MPRNRITAGLLLAILVAGVSGCAVNPVTGKNEIAFVSESQELAIGKKNYAPTRQAQGGDYVVEPGLTAYVRSVGDRVARVSDRKLPYEFSVINDSSPNAWALPGGKISINRGLLVELDNEAELAAVLAHEIVHAAARHSAQSMERGVFLQGALVAAGAALGDTRYRDIGMLGANIGAQLTNQKFGRDDETEADLYGIRYMARAGYDPAAAVRLQETFVRLADNKQPDWLAGLFASHPPSQARVIANRQQVAEMGNPGGEVGQARYQRAIARLKRTKPAYDAFDEAQRLAKDNRLDAALNKVNSALRIEPKEAAFYSLRGEIRAAQKDKRGARKDLDRAVALNPDYFRPLLLRGIVRREAGDASGARRDLQNSVNLLPTAEGYYGLGEVAVRQGQRDQAITYYRKAATSDSGAGKRASTQLARLDLEANPSRYLKATLGLDRDGYLVVKVSNKTRVAVRGVRVVVGTRVGNGIRERASYRIRQTLPATRATQLRTELGPMDVATARRFAAVVTAARLAE